MSPDERAALTTKLRGGRPADDKAIQLDPTTRVIAVASGKGGVGKSSLTANLAAALRGIGQRVGILDADIYGHSIPHMLGIRAEAGARRQADDPAGRARPEADVDRLLRRRQQAADVARADAAPGARAVPAGRPLGRARRARRRHAARAPATSRSRSARCCRAPRRSSSRRRSRWRRRSRAAPPQMAPQDRACSSLGVIENMTSEVFGSGGGERLAAELGVQAARPRAARRADPRGRPTRARRSCSPTRTREPARGDRRDRRARSTRAAAPASRARCRLSPDDAAARARRRSASRPTDAVGVLADHFLDAEATRSRRPRRSGGSSGSRPGPISTRTRARDASSRSRGYERWDGNGALGYLVLNAVVEAQLADPPRARARSSSRDGRSRPACSATGRGGWPTAGSSPR